MNEIGGQENPNRIFVSLKGRDHFEDGELKRNGSEVNMMWQCCLGSYT